MPSLMRAAWDCTTVRSILPSITLTEIATRVETRIMLGGSITGREANGTIEQQARPGRRLGASVKAGLFSADVAASVGLTLRLMG